MSEVNDCPLGYGHGGHWCGPHTNCWLDPRPKHERGATPALAQPQPSAAQSAPDEREAVRGPWFDGEPPHPWNKEWFIAETIYGDRVVLCALHEDHTYDYRTADGTYMLAKNIKRWCQFPDSEYVKLRNQPIELPAYSDERGSDGELTYEAKAHNKCLDEVARLNPVAKPQAGASRQRAQSEPGDSDPNAPWLTLAHVICSDAGIEPGHIAERLEKLRERQSAPVAPEGYVLAKQTAVEMPDGSKELGYTLLDGIGIFGSADDVFEAIRELSLPIGWVSMRIDQLLPGFMLAAAPQPAARQEQGDIVLNPKAQELLAQCIAGHAYVLGVLVNGRPDLALVEATKWVDGFSDAAALAASAEGKA